MSFHATCKSYTHTWLGQTVIGPCELDTTDPALFELHMKELHKGGRTRWPGADGKMRAPMTKLRTTAPRKLPTLTTEERGWLGAWVTVDGNRGQVWCMGRHKGYVWVACDDGDCREYHASSLERVA